MEAHARGYKDFLSMSITDPHGKELERIEQQEEVRYHFSAWTAGGYEFCIWSMNPAQAVDIIFSI